MNAAKGVHILDFNLRAVGFLPFGTDGNVHVRAHIALFKIAFRDAGIDHHFTQSREIRNRFIGRTHIRL